MLLKKIVAVSLALVLAFSFWGCGSAGGLSPQEVDEFVANTIAANGEVETARFDMNMSMSFQVVGGTEPGTASIAVDATGVVDSADREMQMAANVTLDVPGLGKQEMPAVAYAQGDWMYAKASVPGEGDHWAKIRLTEDIWQQQVRESQMEQQIEFLKTAVEVNYSGIETISGTDCYVFEIVPDTGALLDMLSQQQDETGMDFSQMSNLDDLIKEMSVKMWIARDNYLVMKADIHLLMEMLPGDVGAAETDFTTMTVQMDVGVSMDDYNQPVSIELPPEALSAEEVF